VDGGQSQVGIESTVVDLTRNPPVVLRPGMIHEPSLIAVTGALTGHREVKLPQPLTLRSPGLLKKHYAPKAKLLVLRWQNDSDLQSAIGNWQSAIHQCHVITHSHIPSAEGFAAVSVIPHDAEAFARAIYAELHRCDETGAELIVVEALPEAPEWRAIADRLSRAAA